MLKKDIKIDTKSILYKSTEGHIIGISWGDNYDGDMYHVVIKDKRYMINKKDCDVY